MKKILLLAALLSATAASAQLPAAEKQLDRQTLHPRFREWAAPTGGVVVTQNPPALLWPSQGDAKQVQYRVRLAQDSTFTQATVSEPFEWAAYTCHKPLSEGRWYWQWSTAKPGAEPRWSEVNSFTVDASARRFETPTGEELLRRIVSTPHHRLYVSREKVEALRKRALNDPEAQLLVTTARKKLDMDFVPVAPTRPRDTTGMTAFQKRNMINFMYHKFGEVVTAPAVDFSLAYLLTGEEVFARAAVKHALYAAKLPVDSDATSEDFNRSAIMYGLAVAYDTAYDFMTPEQRAEVLEAIRVRGERFYKNYVKDFETHSMDNHVWQHTFRNFLFAAIATAGDLPNAGKWVRYGYEVWCSRFPILGGDDGGWHDGCSYFEANVVTFVYVPFVLSRLTGVDFFDIPWYRNLPSFLINSFPKNSFATGFGDDYEKLKTPPAQQMGFADALARELKSPEARWYADQLIGDDPQELYKAKTFRLYRILTDNAIDCVKPEAPKPNTSRFYPDAGFSLMHTDAADARQDLMAAFFALPFGSTGHAHAAHNGFTINYGGRELFSGTGYYSNFNDKHTLMHYRTRGHNTILVDGMAQVIGENGYGWLARFADNEAMTYTLGDATQAYDSIRTPFWIDRMKQSEVDYTRENGFGDPGVTRFRRHFVLLKPGIIVIYDELAAKNPVTWTWLLHGYNRFEKLSDTAVQTSNGAASGRMDLFTQGALGTKVTDQFFSPAINWKKRTGENGKLYDYANQWHAEFETGSKSAAKRFLAVFRITPEGMRQVPLKGDGEGRITVGEWSILAELDASKPAQLTVKDRAGNAVLYNTSDSKISGSTLIRAKGQSERELIDEIPASVR